MASSAVRRDSPIRVSRRCRSSSSSWRGAVYRRVGEHGAGAGAGPDQSTADRWPAFGALGVAAGVRSAFAFPLHLGAIRIGVLVLYRDRPGELDGDELAYGLVFADLATWVILGLQSGAPVDGLHD